MEEANERNREKYEGLINDCHIQGWKERCLPVGRVQRLYRAVPLKGLYCTQHHR